MLSELVGTMRIAMSSVAFGGLAGGLWMGAGWCPDQPSGGSTMIRGTASDQRDCSPQPQKWDLIETHTCGHIAPGALHYHRRL